MTAQRHAMLLGIAVLVGACSVKSLPPGTPPPEYEKRTHEPWPPLPPDAGIEDAAQAPAPIHPEPRDAPNDAGALDAAAPPFVPATDAGLP